jgi:uncharacterized protein (TIGR02246 family)
MTLDQARAAQADWAAAFNAGNLEALLATYTPDAILIPPGGPALTGAPAIRACLEGFLALKGKMILTTLSVNATADTALITFEWILENGKTPDGQPVPLAGKGVEVHRKLNGKWLIAIDKP